MDELEAVRRFLAEPPSPSDAVTQRERKRLMELIEAGSPGSAEEQVRRMPYRVALVAVPAVAMVLAAAAWAALRTEAREAVAFSCVTEGVMAVLPNDGTPPVDACRGVWESGGMVVGVTAAPDLVACINGASAIQVIEGTGPDDCAAAGLGPWDDQAAFVAAGAALRDVRIDLHDRAATTGDVCATVADWERGLAAQPGTVGWKVEVDQVEEGRHCYDVGMVDPGSRSITVIGVPGNASIGCDPRTGC
jgi:hypothetical protein